MEETLKLYFEYAMRVISISPWEVTATYTFLVGLLFYLYYNSRWHQERVMSRKKINTRHRKVMDVACQVFAEGLQRKEIDGTLKHPEVLRLLKKLRDAGFKEVGPEPSFGRPWYYGPDVKPHAAKVKAAINKRMQALNGYGWSLHNSKEKDADRKRHNDLLASISKKSTAT